MSRVLRLKSIRITREDFTLGITSLYELTIYTLARDFGENGLRMTNSELAEFMNTDRRNIPRILRRLEEGQFIKCHQFKGARIITLPDINLKSPDDIKSTSKRHQIDAQVTSNLPCPSKQTVQTEQTEWKTDFFFSYWNSKKSLPTIREITQGRRKQLAIRMREKTFAENWQLIVDKIAASKFCTGQNDRGWKVDVDWTLKNETNYVKVLEGKYDNPSEPENRFGTRPATEKDLARLEAEEVLA